MRWEVLRWWVALGAFILIAALSIVDLVEDNDKAWISVVALLFVAFGLGALASRPPRDL